MFKQLNKFFFSTSTKLGGNLYTWGKNPGALGYTVSNKIQELMEPQQVNHNAFNNNVIKVSLGNNHSAAITTDGSLYTFGSGKYGVLGHNDGETSHTSPKLVEFFNKNNLKVVDACCGEYFTIALTEDGDCWTWGYGGKDVNMLLNLFYTPAGSLGHGDVKTRYTPVPVDSLRKLPPIKQISAGYNFASVLNAQNQLYNWGKGDYGVLGDGSNKSQNKPVLNNYFEMLRNDEKITIQKIKSSNNYTVASMSDGNLLGWGSNESGQMGIKNEIGIEIFETANFPTQIVTDDFKNHKIIDYDIGEDIMVLLTDNNKVFWSGIRIAYKPELMKIPEEEKITHIGACFRCVVAVSESGNIYFKNKYMKQISINDNTGVSQSTVKQSFQQEGKVISIGGNNRNRFAIVQQ